MNSTKSQPEDKRARGRPAKRQTPMSAKERSMQRRHREKLLTVVIGRLMDACAESRESAKYAIKVIGPKGINSAVSYRIFKNAGGGTEARYFERLAKIAAVAGEPISAEELRTTLQAVLKMYLREPYR